MRWERSAWMCSGEEGERNEAQLSRERRSVVDRSNREDEYAWRAGVECACEEGACEEGDEA